MVVIVGDHHEFSAGAARLAAWALCWCGVGRFHAMALFEKRDEVQGRAGRFVRQTQAVSIDGFCQDRWVSLTDTLKPSARLHL